jgi:hypothetical protein
MFVYLPIWDQDAANPDKQRHLSIENQAANILKVLEEEKALPVRFCLTVCPGKIS